MQGHHDVQGHPGRIPCEGVKDITEPEPESKLVPSFSTLAEVVTRREFMAQPAHVPSVEPRVPTELNVCTLMGH